MALAEEMKIAIRNNVKVEKQRIGKRRACMDLPGASRDGLTSLLSLNPHQALGQDRPEGWCVLVLPVSSAVLQHSVILIQLKIWQENCRKSVLGLATIDMLMGIL